MSAYGPTAPARPIGPIGPIGPPRPSPEASGPPRPSDRTSDARQPLLGEDDSGTASSTFVAVVAECGDPRAWCSLIPEWACDTKVYALAMHFKETGEAEALPTQCCVGPATWFAFAASSFTWFLFLFVSWEALQISKCNMSGVGRGIYAYADPAWIWIPISPIFILLVLYEFKCLTYFIIPAVQVIGHLQACSVSFKFMFWLPISFALSMASHMGLVTNGIFFATTLKTMSDCQAAGNLACIWRQTLDNGIFGYLPEFFQIRFNFLVYFCWGSMFAQAFYGLAASIPLAYVYRSSGYRKPVYEVSSNEECRSFMDGGPGEKTMYKTLVDSEASESGHGAALLALADSCRMASITGMRVAYAKTKVHIYLKQKKFGPAFGLMRQVAQASLFKLTLVGVFQTGLQLNLQVSALGMATLLSKVEYNEADLVVGFGAVINSTFVNHQIVFSVITGLFNFAVTFHDLFEAFKWIHNTLEIPKDKDGLWCEYQNFRTEMKRWRLALFVGLGLYAIVFVYTVAKLWAVFQCPYSMFNVTGCAAHGFEKCLRIENHNATDAIFT